MYREVDLGTWARGGDSWGRNARDYRTASVELCDDGIQHLII